MARAVHVSQRARGALGLPPERLDASGRVRLEEFSAVRELAEMLSSLRREAGREGVGAGELNAAAVLHELWIGVLRRLRAEAGPEVFAWALTRLEETFGRDAIDDLLRRFVVEFPPPPVVVEETTIEEWLTSPPAEVTAPPRRETLLEDLLVLWLENRDPELAQLRDLFADDALDGTVYVDAMALLLELLAGYAPAAAVLVDALRRPLERHEPLSDQLRRLGDLVAPPPPPPGVGFAAPGPAPSMDILRALDHLAEERPRGPFVAGGQAAEVEPDDKDLLGPPRFSPDDAWMPGLVLVAKNVFVWLDQLTRRHGRTITTLADIPDSELDALAQQGFTGLWLIGVWERSVASQTIKRLTGNPEAESSAYAVFDYRVADELGGEEAVADLRDRCTQRGIRLGSDMVPNHTGIDARWVLEHPQRFVQVEQPPFYAYTFEGPDLSSDPAVGIYLEDHYYTRTDASVVFKRVDRVSGEVRYLYHGNDGTHMPWNDTAQLDYTQAEVREAVIGEILRVASLFPILRFDAAMTLTRRHHQRLWWPAPGTGGDIPSRAEHGLEPEEFDLRMPEEFWREVVERVEAEFPGTLLLAEAFWLLETYFVRSLGMNRVYNSAFMNLLRDEMNPKHIEILARALDRDPEILRRFVNFLNNPDEDPAAGQFGKDAKYFGAAVLLATFPGLPMFGHGQVEGLVEKYGMEYRRAYIDEHPDPAFIRRHQRLVRPLLDRRRRFADATGFRLLGFEPLDGAPAGHVYAFLAGPRGEPALVLFHNRAAAVRGRVTGITAPKTAATSSLAAALGLRAANGDVVILTDQVLGVDYVHPSAELAGSGLYVELGPYEHRVVLRVRELHDDSGEYRRVATELRGNGTRELPFLVAPSSRRSAAAAALRLFDRNLVATWIEAVGPAGVEVPIPELDQPAGGPLDAVSTGRTLDGLGNAGVLDELSTAGTLDELAARAVAWSIELRDLLPSAAAEAWVDDRDALETARHRLETAVGLPRVIEVLLRALGSGDAELAALHAAAFRTGCAFSVLAALLLRPLTRRDDPRPPFEEPWLAEVVDRAGTLAWLEPEERAMAASRIRVLLREQLARDPGMRGSRRHHAATILRRLLGSQAGRHALGVHSAAGSTWIRREALEELLASLLWHGAASLAADASGRGLRRDLAGAAGLARSILRQVESAGYRVEALAPKASVAASSKTTSVAGAATAEVAPAPPVDEPTRAPEPPIAAGTGGDEDA